VTIGVFIIIIKSLNCGFHMSY